MNIVKTESIYLSMNEHSTFDQMIHILDGLVKYCNDPTHRKTAEDARDAVYKVWGMVSDDAEVEDDSE